MENISTHVANNPFYNTQIGQNDPSSKSILNRTVVRRLWSKPEFLDLRINVPKVELQGSDYTLWSLVLISMDGEWINKQKAEGRKKTIESRIKDFWSLD